MRGVAWLRLRRTPGRARLFASALAFSSLVAQQAAGAILEIHTLDIWAQPLTSPTLTVKRDGSVVAMSGSPLKADFQRGAYTVKLEAPQHQTLEFRFAFNAERNELSTWQQTSDAAVTHGIALGRSTRTATPDDGSSIQVFTFYLGLQHRWFAASGRPARHGNSVRLLMDGEETWNAVANDIGRARKTIHISSWMWESNHEVLRPAATHATLSERARQANTIIAMLDASPATKRVLVWGLPGASGLVTTDGTLRARGAAKDDRFEFMPQANPTGGDFLVTPPSFNFGARVKARLREFPKGHRLVYPSPIHARIPEVVVSFGSILGVEIPPGSYHQKFITIDSDIAFVGGMNVKGNDWDTSEHLVFEPRRAPLDATAQTRESIHQKREKPSNPPRKDYMLRIEGPTAQDVGEVFRARWDLARWMKEANAENSRSFRVSHNIQPRNNGLQAQVTTTMPFPLHENSTLESWLNAIENAERYIYIEDQYFRMPIVNERIIARMTEKPELKLIVIVHSIGAQDPMICWTRKSHAAFQPFRDRYMLLQLRSFDTVERRVNVLWQTTAHFVDIDVHSKILIVDDKYLSVGSTNKNNRGLLYEGEMNVAVADPAFVRAARKRIFANILPAGTPETDDPNIFWRQIREAAQWNDDVSRRWQGQRPTSLVTAAASQQTTLPLNLVPKRFIYSFDVGNPVPCHTAIENNPNLF